jgi:hypothetical protein
MTKARVAKPIPVYGWAEETIGPGESAIWWLDTDLNPHTQQWQHPQPRPRFEVVRHPRLHIEVTGFGAYSITWGR